ncbi:helix-turn-helix domain-containing protein [Xanthomonas sp. NCPPB 2632]|uniref:helix-turn-helix domain-containing protein n=1 Tax=Xanthomonas sp. NCPPB 2632 TaxID=3240912 RepID=UPI0035120702
MQITPHGTPAHPPSAPPGVLYASVAGEVIRLLRMLQGRGRRTQAAVADRLGFAGHSTLARIERGTVLPNIEQLASLAKLFGTTPSLLLADADALALMLVRNRVVVAPSKRDLDVAVERGDCEPWKGRIHDLLVLASPDAWSFQGEQGWEIRSIRRFAASLPSPG